MLVRHMILILAAQAFLGGSLALTIYAADDFSATGVRAWTDSTGRFQTQGKLIDGDLKSIRIKKLTTGTTITVAVARLSAPDQEYLARTFKSAPDRRQSAADRLAGVSTTGQTAKPAPWAILDALVAKKCHAGRAEESSGGIADVAPLLSSQAQRVPENMIYIRLSRAYLERTTHRDVSRQSAVNDNILGTPVTGVADTSAQVNFELQPNRNAAVGMLRFAGTERHQTVANGGPVQLFYYGATQFESTKMIWFDGQGLHVTPATSTARSQSTLTGTQTSLPRLRGRISLRIARGREAEQHAQAEEITAQHVRRRIDKAFDESTSNELAAFWRNVRDGMAAIEMSGSWKPRGWHAHSTSEAFEIVVLGPPGDGSGFVSAPTTKLDASDIVVDVHVAVVKAAMTDPNLQRLLQTATAAQILRLSDQAELPSIRWSDDANWLSIAWKAGTNPLASVSRRKSAATTAATGETSGSSRLR